MKNSILFTLLIALVMTLSCFNTMAQVSFTENKGQWDNRVLFRANIPSGAMFIEEKGIMYSFVDQEDVHHSFAHHNSQEVKHDGVIHYHAYKVDFLNSTSKTTVHSNGLQEDYINYYTSSDRSKWRSHVRNYDEIFYDEIYPGIDMRIYLEENSGLKYDLVLSPGSDHTTLSMRYSGVDKISLDESGNLNVKTSVLDVIEQKPYAYQLDENGNKAEVKCNYVLEGNILSFSFPEGYDKKRELIIDPVLIFCTYSGSTVDNWGFTATYDLYGNVFSGGIVEDIGYPVSVGAYQTTHGGGNWDVGIIKYNSNGTNRIWATYLGGSGCEIPHSLVVNAANELLIFGTTGSSDFPVTPGAYSSTFHGGEAITYDNTVLFPNGIDIYVSKLSEDGTQLLGSTYVGGSQNDGLNFKSYIDDDPDILMHGNDSLYYNYADGARGEIITDGKNNVYIGTTTFSTDFPVTAGAFQTTHNGGQEGVVFKLNDNLTSMKWCSYIGGSGDDAVYSVDTDDEYDVYISGGTVSSNFPTTLGAYRTSYQGGTADGFVTHINNDGNQIISSTYFGSPNYDQVYFVRTDKYNNIYITGQTRATGTSLVYNALYNVSNGGQFIAKMHNSLQALDWSTQFGSGSGRPDISITAFTVDVCNRVYLSGWGREWAYHSGYDWTTIGGTKNLPTAGNPVQSTTDGQDFYIMVLSDDASQLEYATFFGEQYYSSCFYSGHDHVDGGTSRFDKKGNIYQSVCASCGGCTNFPTTPGAWSENNGAAPYNNCNNAVFRFTFLEDFCVADFLQPEPECAPFTIDFTNLSAYASEYYWDFGDNSTSTATSPSHTYTETGLYDIMLVAKNPGSCNLADTIVKQIQILSNSVDTLAEIVACPGDDPQIGIDPDTYENVTYQWYPSTYLSNPNDANPFTYSQTDISYMLVASLSDYCKDTMFQNVSFMPDQVMVSAEKDTMVCSGKTVTMTGLSGDDIYSWLWSTSMDFSNPLNPNVSDNQFTVTVTDNITYYLRGNGEYCNAWDTAKVVLSVIPIGVNAGNDTTICSGDSVNLHLTNLVTGDSLQIQWSPGSTILQGANSYNPLVLPGSTTTYTVTAVNQSGCDIQDQVTVTTDTVNANIASSENVSCFGLCDGSANLLISSGTPPYVFNWSHGASGSSISGLCKGIYDVTISDAIGCTDISSVSIIQPTLLQGMISTENIICNGSCNGHAEVVVNGGTQPYSYLWSNGQIGYLASGLCVGTYQVTLADENNCDTIMSVSIADPSDLSVSVMQTDSIYCFGNCTAGILTQPQDGTPPYSYTWNNGRTTQSLSDLCAGNYTVSVTDDSLCLRIASIAVGEPFKVTSTVSNSGIPCYGELADVTANGAGGTGELHYSWQDEAGLVISTTNSLTEVSPGNYYVTITDDNGCSGVNQITVTQPDLLEFDSLVTELTCYNACDGSIRLRIWGGTHPYDMEWTNYEDDSVNTELCSGPYTVTITDANGCSVVQEFDVGISDYIPELTVWADDSTLFPGQSTVLHGTAGYNQYVWTPQNSLTFVNSSNPGAKPESTTTYRLDILDSHGCPAHDTITIFITDVYCSEPYIYVPNAFTPNNDGKNDVVYVYSNMIDELYFAIYDRWGELMFETNNIRDGWDGSYRGKDADPAVFVYYLKATCYNKQTFVKQGNITLIR